MIWGVYPLFFKELKDIPALEIVAHRILWCALLTLAVVIGLGRLRQIRAAVRDRKVVLGLAASGLAVTSNWSFYVWAVTNDHALDASMGYFINPLVTLLLGAVFLRERLSRRQGVAVLLVVLGVVVLAVGLGRIPWVALILPVSFGLYALLRKVVAVDALVGLTIETLWVCPLAIGYLALQPGGGALFGGDAWTVTFLLLTGPVTALPLALFAFGTRRLRLATVGLLQYVSPTMQMALAVLLFHEPFYQTHAITFALIWSGIVLYSLPARRQPGDG